MSLVEPRRWAMVGKEARDSWQGWHTQQRPIYNLRSVRRCLVSESLSLRQNRLRRASLDLRTAFLACVRLKKRFSVKRRKQPMLAGRPTSLLKGAVLNGARFLSPRFAASPKFSSTHALHESDPEQTPARPIAATRATDRHSFIYSVRIMEDTRIARCYRLPVSNLPRRYGPLWRDCPRARGYSMATRRSNLKSFNIFPVPNTTLARGSSAMDTGNPVS
jgi:hypothetical protein